MTDRHTADKEPGAFRTISEVADELDVPQHVLRFWETRFSQIRPLKRGGGRRFYRPEDVALIRGIRHLLYGEGYTIKGVQRILKEEGVRSVQQIGSGEVQPDAATQASPQMGWPDDEGHGQTYDLAHDPDRDGEASDFPAVVRPQPYSSGMRAADTVASPPVAVWSGQDDDTALTYGQGGAPAPYDRDDVAAAHPHSDPRTDPAGGYAPGVYNPAGSAGLTGARLPAPEWPGEDVQADDAAPYGAGVSYRGDAFQPGATGEGAHMAGSAYVAPAHVAPAYGEATGLRLAPSQRAILQEALAELLECRRILSHARGELDGAD